MYYTIYITTCLVNNKKYIGKHVTQDINDLYLGSGMLLEKAIKKYGRDKFRKEILYVFDNEDDMNNKEIELVNDNIIESDEYYNIAYGGQGGNIVLNPLHPLYGKICKKISESALRRSEIISSTVKELHNQKRCGMYGKKQSEQQKQLVSKSLKGRKHTEEHNKKHHDSLMKTLTNPNYIHPNKGKSKPKKNCEHCGKIIDNGNYKRYHGEKCKFKKEVYNEQ
jgi:group I intron endonuclease